MAASVSIETDDLDQKSVEELRSEHRELEERLENLETPRSLSPEEEYEMHIIKKRKLSIKDKLMDIETS